MTILLMVRVDECFQCGVKEKDIPLVYSTSGPVLCTNCYNKSKKENVK